MSGIHGDAVGAQKREAPSWVGLLQPKHRLVLYFFSQAGIGLSFGSPAPICTQFSVLREVTFPLPRGLCTGVGIPVSMVTEEVSASLLETMGGKQGGVGPTLWPIAGLLLGPGILRR